MTRSRLSQSTQRLGAIVAALLLGTGNSALAIPPQFAEGVRFYNARQHSAAIAKFTEALRQEPANPLIHYYMGLSYQGSNQMSLAKQQYEWVAAASPDPNLRSQASMALTNLGRYSSSNNRLAIASARAADVPIRAARRSNGAKLKGRLKVIDFYADW
jgi:tetratricopeptide (TPR) repeat protein